ncbi:MAG TPA: tetratricopeptide repeat protein [Acidimicrobiales bacterium]|nr:tetratricopeptide repeat protein [Acidimicrobiales bacterium]
MSAPPAARPVGAFGPHILPNTAAEVPRPIRGRFRGRRARRLLLVVVVLAAFGGGVAVDHFAVPGHRTASTSAQENLLFQQAGNLLSAGRLSAAEKIYVKILKLDPLNSFAYYDLGLIYQQASDPSDATSAYEKALLLKPDYQPALFNLAEIETVTNPAAAISLYEQIQKLPNLSQPAAVAFNLGLLLLQSGKTSEGYVQIDYAVSLDKSLLARIPSKYLPLPGENATSTT